MIFNASRLKASRRFFAFLAPFKGRWALLLALNGVGVFVALASPFLIKLILDKGVAQKDLKAFINISAFAGILYLIGEIVNRTGEYLYHYAKMRIHFDLSKALFRKIQRLPLDWIRERSTGGQIYNLSYDVDMITDLITTTTPQALSVFPRSILTLGILFSLDWRMASAALFLAPIIYIPSYFIAKKTRKMSEEMVQNSELIYKELDETLSHMHLVKAFGYGDVGIKAFLRRLIKNIRVANHNEGWASASSFIAEILSKTIVGVIAFYGIFQVIHGNMTLGSLAAIVVYLLQLLALQGQCGGLFQTIAISGVSCDRIAAILDELPERSDREGERVFIKNGTIAFQKVSFGYRTNERILRGLTFSFAGGRHYALVGASGCGKTTILSLLLRLYTPSAGAILIDNHEIASMRGDLLKFQIGVALQEPLLWNDTIEANIRYGKAGATKEEIAAAARIALVDEFVGELPKRYATIIGENACRISEGQKQKIAIARALVKAPPILILDEATASMDSASEEKIIAAIKASSSVKTLITVSHRLSAVRAADLVYYLSAPDLMRVASCADLLNNDASFRALFARQERP